MMEHNTQPSREEQQLVERCLLGEDAAWQTMFERYHPSLLSIINARMRSAGPTDLAEEVASAVWSSLCRETYAQLRRYDPQRGRLLGYLAGIARREIQRQQRAQRVRFARECVAARIEATWEDIDRPVLVQEFLTTLTRREREFCVSELLNHADVPNGLATSAANEWQLRCRVLKKFRSYFLGEKIHIS